MGVSAGLIITVVSAVLGTLLGWITWHVISATWKASVRLFMDCDLSPEREVEIFDYLNVRIRLRALIDALTPNTPCKISQAYAYAQLGSTMLADNVQFGAMKEEAEANLRLLIIAAPGEYILHVGCKNVKLIGPAPVGEITEPFDVAQSFIVKVKPLRGSIDIDIPREVKVGERVRLTGTVKVKGKPPKAYAAWMRGSYVVATIDGKEYKSNIDIDTGRFVIEWTPDRPGDYTITLTAYPAQTFAYVGAWAQLSAIVTASGELKVSPATIKILQVSPSNPQEGQTITVDVKYMPYRGVRLAWDDEIVDYGVCDAAGNVILRVPARKVREGEHTLRVESEDKKAIDSMLLTVKPTPSEVKTQLIVTSTLRRVSLYKGGTYSFIVDTMERTEDGQTYNIPHEVEIQVGDVYHNVFQSETGLSGYRLHFPVGKYKERIVLDILAKVRAKGEVRVFEGGVTLG